MREILFRGKHPNGEWVEGSLIAVKDFTAILEYESDRYEYPYLDNDLGIIDGDAVPVIPATVGQYTGLTDKNGQKIFEGDVVHMRTSGLSGHGEIVFKDGSFGIEDKKRNRFYYMYHDAVYRIDGNIHDNPELLEGGAPHDE